MIVFLLQLLVQQIEGVDVEKTLPLTIEQAIVFNIGARKEYSVVTSAEMNEMIKFTEQKMQIGCENSSSCLAEIQNRFDVEKLIAGKIVKLGDEYILTINSVNVNNGTVGKRVNIQGVKFEEIKNKIPHAIDQILGLSKQIKMFQLEKGEKLSVAVMPLITQGIEQATGDALTQILAAEMNSIEGMSVIAQDDINAMLGKVEKDLEMQCSDSIECIVEIGAALGLSKLITGTVGKVKDTFVISIQLIDTRKAKVLARVLESYSGDRSELTNAIKLAAYQIAGVDYSSKKGSINFTFNTDQAKIIIGETKDQLKDSTYRKKDMLPGRYFLKVLGNADDFFPFQTDIYVAPGITNVKTFSILERPAKWYETWWFWTATTAIVAAAGATTYYFYGMGDTPLATVEAEIGK